MGDALLVATDTAWLRQT